MPCDSSYLEPTRYEREIWRAAGLLKFLLTKLSQPIPAKLDSIRQYYPSKDDGDYVVALLCDTLRKMSKSHIDAIVYDAKDRTARDLANWWEDHQKADEERIEQEKAKELRKKQKEVALAKLTKQDKDALGIK